MKVRYILAIKKMTFNKEGLVEEKEVDKKTPIPKAPPKVPARRRVSSTAKAVKTVKVVRPRDDGGVVTADGRSVNKIDDLVTKVKCPKCGSERVVKDASLRPACGLCGTGMRLVQ